MKRQSYPGCAIVVSPSGSSTETKLVFLVMFVTLVICGSSIGIRNLGGRPSNLPVWQVDAFSDLNTRELSVFNELLSAGPEIDAFHEDEGGWPTVLQLEEEYIPPFVKNNAWKKNGRIFWQREILSNSGSHVAIYKGTPENIGKMSSTFLLIMMHDHAKKQGNAGMPVHAPHEVWIHSSMDKDFPETVTDQALISSGWKEVVARRGEDEMKRTKGEEFM